MVGKACRTCPGIAVRGSSQCARCGSGPRNQSAELARRALRRAVNRAGRARCAHCGLVHLAERIRVDHIVALADGGRDEPRNVQPLCVGCHQVKTREEEAVRVHRRARGT